MKLTAFLTAVGTVSAVLLGAAEVQIAKPNTRQLVSDYIPIDNAKSYTLTINAKGTSGKVNFWLQQFDVQKRSLGAFTVHAVTPDVTETVGPIVRGATSFIVKDASKWVNPKYGAYIFAANAKADGSDMPNFEIDYQIKKITKLEDGTWKIEMANKLNYSRPAGTLVRQQWDGDHMGGRAHWGGTLPMTKPFSVTINPVKGAGIPQTNWWLGAKFVRVMVMTTSTDPVSVDFTLTEAGK